MVYYNAMPFKPNYKRPFSQFVKKAHKPLQLVISDEVELVCGNPDVGKQKVGDLAEIWVHKFKFNRQEYLLAYRPPSTEMRVKGRDVEFLLIDFYQVGSHENFYEDLKRYLKTEGHGTEGEDK